MAYSLPTTIDEVLAELDAIIAQSIANNDARGIFAFVYRRTTAEIKSAIEGAEFENSEDLHQFDVAFANFYVQAYRQFRENEKCSLVWERSFSACKDKLCVAQHILLGMNAHINLDLALATAAQGKGKNIRLFESDFVKVNVILARIVNELQQRLSRVSPLFFMVDWLGQNTDEKLINFSMERARGQAWNLAVQLHDLDDVAFSNKQKMADEAFALFAQQLWKPNSKILRWLLRFINFFEEKNVAEIIRKMQR